jgi:hypothetical protein
MPAKSIDDRGDERADRRERRAGIRQSMPPSALKRWGARAQRERADEDPDHQPHVALRPRRRELHPTG